jgi:PhnB protein
MIGTAKPIPAGYHNVTAYLTVKNGLDAIAFYKQAFGAEEVRRVELPSGKIAHADLKIGDSMIMLADEFPGMGSRSPRSLGGSPVLIHLYTDGVDKMMEQALTAGASLRKPVQNQFYGDRMGALVDPFGHEWCVATHVEDIEHDELQRRTEERLKAGRTAA